jgi:PPP family 3-phenylpropionic acid transporter
MRTAAFRLHFFLLYAVVGAYLPYVPVFLGHDLGLQDQQIGWIVGAYGLAVLLAPPVMAALADSKVAGRSLVGAGHALSAAVLLAFAGAEGFAPALALSIAFGLAYTPMTPLLDGLVFAEMARARAAGQAPPAYGALRVWGSLGFMAPAFVLFAVLYWDLAGGQAAMLVGAAAAALAALCARLLPRVPPPASEAKVPTAAAWAELRQPPTLALIGPLVLLFASISVFYAFYPRLIVEVGIDRAWVGLVSNLGVLFELPWVLLAGPLLGRASARSLMLLGAGCMAARMGLLALVATPTTVLATQLLHGPVVLSLYVLPPMVLDHKASPACRNSVQGLYAALCYGAARFVGSGAGGHAAEYGLAWAFALAAALAFAAALWLALSWRDPAVETALRGSR